MRVLGLDLGTRSVKAVEIDTAFGRFQVHDYHERKVSNPRDRILLAAQLIESLPKKPDRVTLAIPPNLATFRNMEIPTRDKKAITSAIEFELEDELPFEMEDTLYSYSILSQTRQMTHVHIAATLRRHIAELLFELKELDIDPDLITTSAWSYRTLLNRTIEDQSQPILLVQLGHTQTLFYLHWRGIPMFSRDFPWGGRNITEAIARKLNISEEEAEKKKIESGIFLTSSQTESATPEQVEISGVIQDEFKHFLAEVRQILLSARNLTHVPVGSIHVTGGTSLIPGLYPALEDRLSVPVKPLQSLSALASPGVSYSEQSDAAFAIAASSALCLIGPEKANALNLRKAEFRKESGGREFSIETAKKILIPTSIVAGSLLASVLVQQSVYETQIENVDTNLRRSLKEFFGPMSRSATRSLLANPSRLKSSINKQLNKQRELAKIQNERENSPISFLRTVSQKIPRDITIDMTQFEVGGIPKDGKKQAPQETKMTFLVANQQTATQLEGILKNFIKDLKTSPLKEATALDGKGKRFEVSYSGLAQPEAFGD